MQCVQSRAMSASQFIHGFRDPALEIVTNVNRKEVIDNGPIRPILEFKTSLIGNRLFKFNPAWYNAHDWLEYSASKDAAFCFTCRCFGTPGTTISM